MQPVSAKNTEIGWFVQDDWRPDDHWQVSAGLRWDYESNAVNNHFVTPAGIAAAIRAYPGWKAAGINPEDYISNGHNRKPFLGEFQPRLGVSYDVKGDRDLVFSVGAGRYYDRSLFIDSALETIKDQYESVATINKCVTPGVPAGCVATIPTDPNALRALGATQGGEVHLLNNRTKIPYSDEVDFGVKKRLGGINTSITFSYIRSHNIYQEVVGNRFPDGTYSPGGNPIFVYNGIPYSDGIFYGGSAIFNAPLPGHGSIFIGNSDGKASYAALYLQADKPYTEHSGWGFSTTLTISTRAVERFAGYRTRSATRSTSTRRRSASRAGAPSSAWSGGGLSEPAPSGCRSTSKLTALVILSSGPSYGGVLCNVPASAPGGGGCYTTNFGIYRPHGIGYKNVDLNITKTFKMPWDHGHELTVYFQALNVFDFVNRNYSMWGGGFQNVGGPGPTIAHDPIGVASQGRNFKVGARYKF